MQSTVLGPQNVDDVHSIIQDIREKINLPNYRSNYRAQYVWLIMFLSFYEERFTYFKTCIEMDYSFRELEEKYQTKIPDEIRKQLILANEKLQEIAELVYNPENIAELQQMAIPEQFNGIPLDKRVQMYELLLDLNKNSKMFNEFKNLNMLRTNKPLKQLFIIVGSINIKIKYVTSKTDKIKLDIAMINADFKSVFHWIEELKGMARYFKDSYGKLKEVMATIKPLNEVPTTGPIDPTIKCTQFNSTQHNEFGLIVSHKVKKAFETVWMTNNLLITEMIKLQKSFEITSKLLDKNAKEWNQNTNFKIITFSLYGINLMLAQIHAPMHHLNEKLYAELCEEISLLKLRSGENVISTIKSSTYNLSNLYDDGKNNCVQIIKSLQNVSTSMHKKVQTILTSLWTASEGENKKNIHYYEVDLKLVVDQLTTVLSIVTKKSQTKINTLH